MKAIVMSQPGGPEVLHLAEISEPTLQSSTELLVRLKAAGVNPIDTKLRKRGTFYPDRQPTVLGCDGAGVVHAVGAGVRRFHVGDEVYFCQGGLGGARGNYAEWAVVEEHCVARKPASLTFAEAAAAPLVLITAWESLFDRAQVQSDQQVLIHGGAGGVGHVAIQLARATGAEVCTTIGHPDRIQLVQDLGATEAILYKTTNLAHAVLDWTDGNGVDLAFDTVGGTVFGQCFPLTRVYGDVVTILEPPADTPWKIARERNLRVSFELMLTPMLQNLHAAQQHQADILEHCTRLFESGRLRIHLHKTFPLAEAQFAHQLLEAGSMVGKLVLVM